ncbi:hypothetical protein V565_149540, partial [Rhizoctonia solani 123E]
NRDCVRQVGCQARLVCLPQYLRFHRCYLGRSRQRLCQAVCVPPPPGQARLGAQPPAVAHRQADCSDQDLGTLSVRVTQGETRRSKQTGGDGQFRLGSQMFCFCFVLTHFVNEQTNKWIDDLP